MVITGRDILCLSSQDWDGMWTGKQRFMQKFARLNNMVLYVEAQASLVSVGILRKDPGRLFRWLKGPRRVEENLFVATLPLVCPFFQMSPLINRLNNRCITWILRVWKKRLDMRDLVLWTYNPYSESLVGRLGETCAVYGCVDELSASRGLVNAEVVKAFERRLIEKADAVYVTHENLLRSKREYAKNIHLVPNGVEIEHFGKTILAETPGVPEMEKIKKPVIGFLGSIQYWVDMDLLRHIAVARPEWSLVLIGPVGRLAKTEKVEALHNVHLLGRKPYSDLPLYLKRWDVCINPYILDETAENCSPLKLYEYIASGKPVVSVDMPEARKFPGIVEIAKTYDEFLGRIDAILERLPEDRAAVERRMAAVASHSWSRRFEDLERALEPLLKA